MKRLLVICAAALMAVAFAGRANALAYSDFQGQDVHFDPVFGGVGNYTWTFDLDNDVLAVGDINPGDVINSATLAFNIDDTLFIPDIALVALDSIPVFLGEVGTGTYNVNVYGWVADHVLVVDVVWIFGDFTVKSLELYGDYTANGNGGPNEPVVPEPATLGLSVLGLSLAGLARRRRKLA